MQVGEEHLAGLEGGRVVGVRCPLHLFEPGQHLCRDLQHVLKRFHHVNVDLVCRMPSGGMRGHAGGGGRMVDVQ